MSLRRTRWMASLSLALGLSGWGMHTPARAETSDTLAAVALLGWNLASPELAAVPAVSPFLWNGLINSFTPFLQPYSEAMRKLALTSAPTLKPVPQAPQPSGPTLGNAYSQIVSFGDSMSDTGNMYQVTMQLTNWGLPMAPNDRGRFSNGPVVLEVMSNTLNKPLLNYAFGGGQSGRGGLVPVFGLQIGMLRQVDDYTKSLGLFKQADSQALYVLWTGPDDYYQGSNIYLTTTNVKVTANLLQAMTTLYFRGARNFFVPLMPDLSITPSARLHEKYQSNYMKNARARSQELASMVTAMLKSFAKTYPNAKVRTFDTFAFSQQQVVQAAADGYNVIDPCYDPPFMGLPGPVCANPDNHLFWDTNHPTAAGARVIGSAFSQAAVGPALPSR